MNRKRDFRRVHAELRRSTVFRRFDQCRKRIIDRGRVESETVVDAFDGRVDAVGLSSAGDQMQCKGGGEAKEPGAARQRGGVMGHLLAD